MTSGPVVVSGLVNLETTVPVDTLDRRAVLYAETPGIVSCPSGVALNVASALGGLGMHVRLLAITGTDLVGASVRAALGGVQGLEVSYVDIAATPLTMIMVTPSGDRAILRDAKGAPDVELGEAPDLTGAAAFVPTNIPANRSATLRARAAGVPVLVDIQAPDRVDDPHNAVFCAAADVLAMSDARLPCPPQEWLRLVGDRFGTPVIILGMAARGAMITMDRGRTATHVPAPVARERSATGAGDALWGCFVDGYLRGLDPVDALRRSVVFASRKISTVGSSRGHLSASDLEMIMSVGDLGGAAMGTDGPA